MRHIRGLRQGTNAAMVSDGMAGGLRSGLMVFVAGLAGAEPMRSCRDGDHLCVRGLYVAEVLFDLLTESVMWARPLGS